jgi:hypothetical protein
VLEITDVAVDWPDVVCDWKLIDRFDVDDVIAMVMARTNTRYPVLAATIVDVEEAVACAIDHG